MTNYCYNIILNQWFCYMKLTCSINKSGFNKNELILSINPDLTKQDHRSMRRLMCNSWFYDIFCFQPKILHGSIDYQSCSQCKLDSTLDFAWKYNLANLLKVSNFGLYMAQFFSMKYYIWFLFFPFKPKILHGSIGCQICF